MRHKKAALRNLQGIGIGRGKSPVAWSHAILSSDRFRRRLAARFAAVLEQLALGAGPVLERLSGRAAALQKNLVGAQGDLFRCRVGPGCAGLRYCWRGTFPRL